ncbi:hypothetical protein GCM10022626_00050 [[Pseudomonas] carboxydohydrogena]
MSRCCATNCSRIFAKQIVHVISEAKARPIITSFTTISADMNIDHGERSCGTTDAFAASAAGKAVGAGAAAAGTAVAGVTAEGVAGAGEVTAGVAGRAGAASCASTGTAPARQATMERHVIKRMVFIRRPSSE